MRKLGFFSVIFAASLLGVLAALQIDKHMKPKDPGKVTLDDLQYMTPASTVQMSSGPPDFVGAAKKITPSVVSVDQRVAERDLFTDRVVLERTGQGSGVLITRSGLILTNNHVVAGATLLTVRAEDGKSYNAKVVGADPRSDLAVIKIVAPDLVPATIGDSSKLEVGQWVLAVGNPLGYSNTVSAGVVSSLKRTLPEGAESPGGLLIDAIQTDAAINPGNSGGALTDADGNLVGINAAIASTNGGSVGLGFAIPINRAKKVVHDIVEYGHVRYGDPGIVIYDNVLDDDARSAVQERVGSLPPASGVIVQHLIQNGPAERAGIRPFDVILSIDGVAMDSPIAFQKIFDQKQPGDDVEVKVWSAGSTRSVKLSLVDLSGT
jgi:S1-C subfamily serine protease